MKPFFLFILNLSHSLGTLIVLVFAKIAQFVRYAKGIIKNPLLLNNAQGVPNIDDHGNDDRNDYGNDDENNDENGHFHGLGNDHGPYITISWSVLDQLWVSTRRAIEEGENVARAAGHLDSYLIAANAFNVVATTRNAVMANPGNLANLGNPGCPWIAIAEARIASIAAGPDMTDNIFQAASRAYYADGSIYNFISSTYYLAADTWNALPADNDNIDPVNIFRIVG
jgi:hypothetical protein